MDFYGFIWIYMDLLGDLNGFVVWSKWIYMGDCMDSNGNIWRLHGGWYIVIAVFVSSTYCFMTTI